MCSSIVVELLTISSRAHWIIFIHFSWCYKICTLHIVSSWFAIFSAAGVAMALTCAMEPPVFSVIDLAPPLEIPAHCFQLWSFSTICKSVKLKVSYCVIWVGEVLRTNTSSSTWLFGMARDCSGFELYPLFSTLKSITFRKPILFSSSVEGVGDNYSAGSVSRS